LQVNTRSKRAVAQHRDKVEAFDLDPDPVWRWCTRLACVAFLTPPAWAAWPAVRATLTLLSRNTLQVSHRRDPPRRAIGPGLRRQKDRPPPRADSMAIPTAIIASANRNKRLSPATTLPIEEPIAAPVMPAAANVAAHGYFTLPARQWRISLPKALSENASALVRMATCAPSMPTTSRSKLVFQKDYAPLNIRAPNGTQSEEIAPERSSQRVSVR